MNAYTWAGFTKILLTTTSHCDLAFSTEHHLKENLDSYVLDVMLPGVSYCMLCGCHSRYETDRDSLLKPLIAEDAVIFN